ncbi:MAG TPA: hypothetical protein VM820_04280 [Vicinamibacterales bacterium]|jgi:hypothetical protein|nr:hypothetical protein [Vicinamibacterales bacterium]
MKAVAVFAVCGLWVCAASASYGQTTQPRKQDPEQELAPPEDSPQPLGKARRLYRALFGGANTGQRRETILGFSGSVFEVYSKEEVDEGEPALDGLYTNFDGDLDYTRYGTRVEVAATGGGGVRYYPKISQILAVEYHAGVGVQARVAPQTTMFVRQSARYGPVALPILFAEPLPPELGDPLPPESDFAVTDDKVVTSLTSASFERGFSVRSQLSASASYRYSDYLAETTPTNAFSTLDSGVAYRYRLNATRSVRLGYNYRSASYDVPEAPGGRGPQPDEHNLFIGVAIERAFSDQQRTIASFEAGTSAFSGTVPTGLLQGGDRLRFVFSAAVAHQMGRSWLLLGSFDRGSRFNQGYGGPAFADSLFASVTGFLNTRVDITGSVAHTQGEYVATLGGSLFTNTAAGARLRYALTRRWALTGQYFRYSYDFTNSPGVPFLIGVPERFARHSLSGGVLVFLPISSR